MIEKIDSRRNLGSVGLKMFLYYLNPFESNCLIVKLFFFPFLVIGGEAPPHHQRERSVSVAEWNKDGNL